MRFLVALLLVAGLVFVSVRKVPSEEWRLSNGLRISDDIPQEEVPADVATMSPCEFAAWARSYNEAQHAAARQRHAAYLAERGPLQHADVVERSNIPQPGYGGGYGWGRFGRFGNGGHRYGGFGGLGGFGSGFSGFGGMMSGLGGLGGLGSGLGLGNNFLSGYTSQTRSYQITYPDLNDTGGGSISIINPFCHDYWSRQAATRAR